MGNAKIFSFANPLTVPEADFIAANNVRLVLVDESSEGAGNYKAPGKTTQARSGLDELSSPQSTLTAYIIIVDTKMGDETGDFPITFGGIKPGHTTRAGGGGGYVAYKFQVSGSAIIPANDKIPLDISAFGDLQALDISDPNIPQVSPQS